MKKDFRCIDEWTKQIVRPASLYLDFVMAEKNGAVRFSVQIRSPALLKGVTVTTWRKEVKGAKNEVI